MKKEPNKPITKTVTRNKTGPVSKSSRQARGERQKQAGWIKHRQVWRSSKAQTQSGVKPAARREEVDLKIGSNNLTMPGGYEHFNQIPAHRLGRALRSELYTLANNLPDDENSNLKQRIKFAATTITASLATGHGHGHYRAAVSGALESRGALYGVQDHLQHLVDQQLMSSEDHERLRKDVDEVVSAVNQYLGQLSKDRLKTQAT